MEPVRLTGRTQVSRPPVARGLAMKHKTWFRLLLKIIGIFLLATAIPSLLNAVTGVVGMTMGSGRQYWSVGTGFDLWNMLYVACMQGLIGNILQCVIGIYLLLGGKFLTDLCIPSNRPYCPDCGYELSGLAGDQCPECGATLPAEFIAAHASPATEQAPTAEPAPPSVPRTGFKRLVPMENRQALAAYYVGVASLIPILGIILGPAAIVYGIEGIRHARQQPAHHGKTHATFGIIVGSATTIFNLCGWWLTPMLIS